MNKHRYRMKSISIEAFQMTKEQRHSNADWPEWMGRAWNEDHETIGALYPVNSPNSDGMDQLVFHTNEGPKVLEWGQWLVLFNNTLEDEQIFAVMTDEEFTDNFEKVPDEQQSA